MEIKADREASGDTKFSEGRQGRRGEAALNEPRNHRRTAGRTDGACERPGFSPGYGAPAAAMEQRLRALEQLVRGEAGASLGLDGLLDLLLGVHHELSSAPLRRERNVAQFLSWGEWSRQHTREGRLEGQHLELCAPRPFPRDGIFQKLPPEDALTPCAVFNACHRTPQPARSPAPYLKLPETGT